METKAGILFRHWVRANYKRLLAGSYEMKDSLGKDSISFKEIKQEQIDHALANKSDRGNLIRVASGTVGAADYDFHRNSTAWFVIRFPKTMEIVDVEAFIMEKEKSNRKSLTSARAREIATISIDIPSKQR